MSEIQFKNSMLNAFGIKKPPLTVGHRTPKSAKKVYDF
jgi:hypothetical protein